MDELRAKLQSEGTLVDIGQFSVDGTRAWDVLQKAQFETFAYWPVPIISAAVGGNTSRIDIKAGYGQVEIAFDAPWLERSHLKNLLAYGMCNPVSSQDTLLKDLALGLITALGAPGRARIETPTDTLEMWSHESRLGPGRGRGVTVTVDYDEWRKPEKMEEELDAWCTYVPVPLTYNFGKRNQTFPVPERAIWLKHPSTELSYRLPVRSRKYQQEPADVSALLWPSRNQVLNLLVRGVYYTRPMPFRGVSALVAAPELRKNLSHTGIVEDDAWKALSATLQSTAARLFPPRIQSVSP